MDWHGRNNARVPRLKARRGGRDRAGAGYQDENHTDAAVRKPPPCAMRNGLHAVEAIIFKASSEHRRENRTLQLSS